MGSTVASLKDALNPALGDAAATVASLAQDFSANAKYYLSSSYQEAEVRKDFIDKFLFALGWDVNHAIQKNPFQQEVKVERNVQMPTAQRRADYALSLGPNFDSPVLYVEAKKPAVEIATPDNYFQIIRYANQRGHALGILTDFEQLHIIDCRFQANIDSAIHRAIRKYHYSDFTNPEKFAEIFYLISRPAIAGGSLEKFAATLPKPKGRPGQKAFIPLAYKPIDERLLKTLDELRSILARALKNSNQQLDSAALTELTQRIIDRLVLIRFLEDKLIEPDPIIPKLGESTDRSAWQDFRLVCRKLDKTYNGIVFRFHPTLDAPDGLSIDDRNFADVLNAFDYHKSEYLFNDIPLHILGSIYERFLGNVIVATKKRATLEPKPEVRKAGGVYYTPKYIVDYIVQNTVGKLIDGKSPGEISKMRFADIACGSGSFLLGVYDCLLKYTTRWYNEHTSKAPKAAVIKRNNVLYLSLQEKGRILTDNIYGVDIDPQAVEVAQLSLCLKLLEEETTASARQYTLEFHRALLPSLAENIKCGNSLIGSDYFTGKLSADAEEMKSVNPFDCSQGFPDAMKVGGFDCIIGNPPYIRVRTFKELHHGQAEYLEAHYRCAVHVWDVYLVFFEQAVRLTRRSGAISLIVPIQTLHQPNCKSLRAYLLENTCIRELADLSGLKVFEGAIVKNCILTCDKGDPSSGIINIRVPETPKELSTGSVARWSQAKVMSNLGLSLKVELLSPICELCDKLRERSWELKELCYSTFGLRSCAKGKGQGGKDRLITTNATAKNAKPYLEGRDIKRYAMSPTNRFIRYLPKEMYSPRSPQLFETPKIVSQTMLSKARLVATYDEHGFYVEQSLACIVPHGVITDDNPKAEVPLKFILGVLNSNLERFYFASYVIDQSLGGGLIHATPGAHDKLIVPKASLRQVQQMVSLVDSMFHLHKQLPVATTDHARTLTQRQIAATDRQIDRLVYDLYGLTEAEIKMVEGATEQQR